MAGLTKRKLEGFLRKWVGKEDNFKVMSGKEGQDYSEYSHGVWYIGFDGSSLYDLFQGYPDWDFHTAFHNFLDQYGYYFEQGHAWNCNIYKG